MWNYRQLIRTYKGRIFLPLSIALIEGADVLGATGRLERDEPKKTSRFNRPAAPSILDPTQVLDIRKFRLDIIDTPKNKLMGIIDSLIDSDLIKGHEIVLSKEKKMVVLQAPTIKLYLGHDADLGVSDALDLWVGDGVFARHDDQHQLQLRDAPDHVVQNSR